MKTILLTGGGTAGHVSPHLALIPLLKKDYKIHYIGSYKGIERGIIESQGIPYTPISVGKLRRYFSWENLKDVFRVLRGTLQAIYHIGKIKPALLFSKGGFVAVPVVLAAKFHKVPIICHESDLTPGIATQITAKFSKTVCTSFPECAKFFGSKGVYTGTPLRENLFQGDAERAKQKYQIGKKPILLIMGGSQGAQAINENIQTVLDTLLESFDILHLCGPGKINTSILDKQGYIQIEYLNEELADVLAASDIVISRAGSNSIAELKALHKPMLLIPYPATGVSRGDQILNAKNFVAKGWAMQRLQEDLSPEILLHDIAELYTKKAEFTAKLIEDGVQNGAETVYSILQEALQKS